MDTTGRDWQKQSFAKNGPKEAAPSQMNPKLSQVPGMTMNPKIAKPTYSMGGLVQGGSMKKAPLRMADGGSVDDETYQSKQYQDDKAAGLAASKDESVGLFERLRMGNIDDPNSEAYRRFGAGRGEIERMKSAPDESAAETRRLAATAPVEEAKPAMTAADFQRTDKDTTPVPMPAKAVAKSSPAKRVAKAVESVTDTGDETARLAARAPAPKVSAPAKPAYDRNRPDTRPAQFQSVTDKENKENFDNIPLFRAARAVGEFFSGAPERYLKSKIERGEKLAPNEEARAKKLGIL